MSALTGASTRAALTVRVVSAEEHLAFVETRSSVSFLQTPAWGEVKSEWRRESLGWFEGETMVGSEGQSSQQ